MTGETSLWLLILIPLVMGVLCTIMPSRRIALGSMCLCIFGTALIGIGAVYGVLTEGTVFAAAAWLFMDCLSAYNYGVLLLVYCLSTAYAWTYFNEEMRQQNLTLRQARLFSGLWCAAFAAMTLILISNNLGIMWVGVEATTLITAFLICIHVSRESLEAMWKYIVICSVGVAFAFMGTLLAAASAQGIESTIHDALLWTKLRDHAAQLDPKLIKAAFIFLLVGYGTKAGLAPMHSWLPDAHSKAPAPVSAIFSGFMLNAALYCVMRYVPIVETAAGDAWGLRLLAGFGIFSIMIAAAFILFQNDLKRLLAYHSIEHLGIIALGVGLGGLGTFAALFHTLNHSLCKTLSFFAAGRLGQVFKSHDMEKMSGSMRVAPVWGMGIFCSLLALIGIAPFALFMSEFQLIKAAIAANAVVTLVLFLLGAAIVFVGALGHVIPLAWGKPHDATVTVQTGFLEAFLVCAPLVLLIILGLWMPGILQTTLIRAARVICNDPVLSHISSGFTP